VKRVYHCKVEETAAGSIVELGVSEVRRFVVDRSAGWGDPGRELSRYENRDHK
jgi:hypothetical protein